MKSDFLLAITQLSAEKNLPKEVVIGAVEAALVSAYRKENFAPNQNIAVKISPATGRVEVWAEKTVVESPSDPRKEISLTEARKLNKDVKLGDGIMVESTPSNAGRIAAQTAKQVILQRLHEAEHSAIFEEYAAKSNDIIAGVVQRTEPKQVFINLGRTEAILPATEQSSNERYRSGQRLKVYVLEVARTNKGPKVTVSRSHPNLLRRLFELEVPEVFKGIVEIKSVAREAGYRSKVAVAARQEGIDPVGCCVGLRGIRIQNIVNELNGEKIDVVTWSADPAVFIANALSPAQVLSVKLNSDVANVVVPDRHLSLAIGRDGQNARLAAKLSGWRIDIKSASMAEAGKVVEAKAETEEAAVPKKVAAEAPVAEKAPVRAKAVAAEEALLKAKEELVAEEVEAVSEEAVEEAVAEEEAVTEEEPTTVLSSSFIPQRLEPPPGLSGKPQIRFAEDIFGTRPGRHDEKPRKKKKKMIHAKAKVEDKARGGAVAPGIEDEG